jgi:hypothetical protein
MNNYWLAHVEKPNVHDKIEIRKLLFEVRDSVFEYINTHDTRDWVHLCDDIHNYILSLMFEYHKNKLIHHFGLAKYLEDGVVIEKLSIQPREWVEYITVEFILTEPRNAIYY